MERPKIEHQNLIVPMPIEQNLMPALTKAGEDGWTPWMMIPGQTPTNPPQPALQVLCWRVASPIIRL